MWKDDFEKSDGAAGDEDRGESDEDGTRSTGDAVGDSFYFSKGLED